MNQTTLHGYLTREPTLATDQNAADVLVLSVVTTEDERGKTPPEYHRVVVRGERVAPLAQVLHKGSEVIVSGPSKTRTYEKNGDKRYITEVHALRLYPVGVRWAPPRDDPPTGAVA